MRWEISLVPGIGRTAGSDPAFSQGQGLLALKDTARQYILSQEAALQRDKVLYMG